MSKENIYICENYKFCRNNNAHNICSLCKKNQCIYSSVIGRYCSRECQKTCYSSHKYIHKLQQQLKRRVDENALDNNYIYETLIICLSEIICYHGLPVLDDSGIFSLLLIGSRAETYFVYDKL